jgi:hypothetical protein
MNYKQTMQTIRAELNNTKRGKAGAESETKLTNALQELRKFGYVSLDRNFFSLLVNPIPKTDAEGNVIGHAIPKTAINKITKILRKMQTEGLITKVIDSASPLNESFYLDYPSSDRESIFPELRMDIPKTAYRDSMRNIRKMTGKHRFSQIGNMDLLFADRQ